MIIKLTILALVITFIYTMIFKFIVTTKSPDILFYKVSHHGEYPLGMMITSLILAILWVLDIIGILASTIYLLFIK